jgi:two-component system, cell cycle response regulator DivK
VNRGEPGTATILVVEDNALNLKLVRDVLTHAGYRILEAASGEEGVRLASEARPDLVLMDLQLPGIGGAEALRQLRTTAGLTMPVVAVTAFAMDEDRAQAERDGFDGYLRKPISVRALPEQVKQLLGRWDDHDV